MFVINDNERPREEKQNCGGFFCFFFKKKGEEEIKLIKQSCFSR